MDSSLWNGSIKDKGTIYTRYNTIQGNMFGKQRKIETRKNNVSPKWSGPYEVTQSVSNDVYIQWSL